jgi:hypothetical protein
MHAARRRREAWAALAGYIAITIAGTWPLTRGLGRDVAWDLGDSVLVMWVLAWDAEQMLAMLRGDFSRLATFFDGNIFFPAPLTLAYSEHMLPQAVQILPIYAWSGNPILCYNLLFLSTFVLSGLGTFLLVRELTGRSLAAFVAGLLFAFAPYRLPQSPHLPVLSAQWMPLALYGFSRFFAALEAGRSGMRPLAGAGASLVLQNLSCGYYLLYFSPFAAAYVLWEIARHAFWRRWRMWGQLVAAGVVVLGATLPFLLPYAAVNATFRFERTRSEVTRYSADVYSYATASLEQPLGDLIRAFPKPEGDLFPGIVPLLLAALALLTWRMLAGTSSPPTTERKTWWTGWLPPLLAAGAVLHLVAAAVGLAYRRLVLDLWLFDLRISNINQLLVRAAALLAVLLFLSPAARARTKAFVFERGFFLLAWITAMWLSLGPAPQVMGRPVELFAPYRLLYEYVPGFDGVRVPARFGMVAVLMLAILGGFGAAAVQRRRQAPVVLAIASAAFLAEALVVPFIVNGVTPPPGYNAPEPRLYRPGRAPAIYREIGRLAPAGVLAELPLGEPDFDLRAMFYSTVHWRPLLNGYSGFYPPHYGTLALAVNDVPRFPNDALEALRRQGATHVLVHEGAYLADKGAATTLALQTLGAHELYRNGADVLLELP